MDKFGLNSLGCILLVLTMLLLGAKASAQEIVSAESGMTQQEKDELALYEKNEKMQLWGKIFLGGGLTGTLAGIALIEIDSWGTIGKSGFITGGASVCMMAVGMFFLGFSSPNHPKSDIERIHKRRASISVTPLKKGSGMALFYNRTF